jgi:hypothetical protein
MIAVGASSASTTILSKLGRPEPKRGSPIPMFPGRSKHGAALGPADFWTALAIALHLWSVSATAADLGAPADKKPTIGSEIVRGYNVSSGCDAQYWDTFYRCIQLALSMQNRRNSDTDAFLLGAYSESLIRLSGYEKQYGRFSWNNGRLGLSVGKEWYLETDLFQRKLDVPNEQLAALLQVSSNYLNKVKLRWSSQALRD